MRIGTWNLEGRWDDRHRDRLVAMACDVLLLTEVSEKAEPPGMRLYATSQAMAPRRRWSAVAVRADSPARQLHDPHGATAAAELTGVKACSSVLPWRSCGTRSPWTGSSTGEKTAAAVADIEAMAPTIWGGDWNHALSGRESAGSMSGRAAIVQTLARLGLQVPTAAAPHQIQGLLSIDHIAVPASWTVLNVEHIPAYESGRRLSDHDAYVVEVDP